MEATTSDVLEPVLISGKRGRIFGMLHLPLFGENGAVGAPGVRFPLIVFCHGFTGEHVGPHRLGVLLGRAAARAGIAVFRYDHVGSGNSDGDFAHDTSISGWMQDLQDVLAFMGEHPRVDSGRIGTLGLSMGGATVLRVGHYHGAVRAVACWSPVVKPLESFSQNVIGPRLWERLQAGETVNKFYNKGFAIAPQFAADVPKHDIFRAAAALPPVPLWIAHGEADPVIPVAHIRELHEHVGEGLEWVVLPGADHVFTDHGPEVVSATVRWFEGRL